MGKVTLEYIMTRFLACRRIGRIVHSCWPWDSYLWDEVKRFASSSLFCESFFPLYQEQLKRIMPVKHWMVLGERWPFQFKTLSYSKPDASSSSLGDSLLFKSTCTLGIEKDEMTEMDKTVSWASPHIYYPLQIEAWSLVRSVIFPTEQALSG